MGRLFLVRLDGKIYSCKHCETHLALCEDIISKEERLMMTGMHTVSDLFCSGCGSLLGWKYEVAHEKSQKYKEGKFIIERCPELSSLIHLFFHTKVDVQNFYPAVVWRVPVIRGAHLWNRPVSRGLGVVNPGYPRV
ncbi:unnamed protein product [Spirodela intermedia]|uniref:Protein yippee-like n=1 Tax=Spirodela intermedia TaxID=51605 RepID=A0A7I8IIF9_SPIIN|nr:unnamed protein product [Spirodela intermedia]CAA6656743.1 unnamed protein product [Spirodela intermedia]